jgi:DnaJ family protein B protein 4
MGGGGGGGIPPGVFAEMFGGGGGGMGGPMGGGPGAQFSPFGGGGGMPMGGGMGGMGGAGGMPAGFAPRGFARGAAGAPAGGGAPPQTKAAPIEIPLRCTLEELFSGATKTRKLTRRVASGGGTREVEELLTIKLKPGWKAGTRITFEAKGDATVPGQVPSDIVFVVTEVPHPVFRRDGADLHASVPVTLTDALGAKRLAATVPGLDGKPVRVEAPAALVAPAAPATSPAAKTAVRVRGEGMPLSKEPGKRGDLVATWDVRLPTARPEAARAAALAALAGATYDLSRAPPPGA